MDEFVAAEFRKRTKGLEHVTHELLTNFLFTEGLVLDGVEALEVSDRWIGSGLVDLECENTKHAHFHADDFPQGSTGSEGDGSTKLAVSTAPQEEDDEDELSQRSANSAVSKFFRGNSARPSYSLLNIRKTLAKKFPGLFETEGVVENHCIFLEHGDSFSLSASGAWVSQKKFSMPSLKQKGHLYLQRDSGKAESFHIVTSESFDDRLASELNESGDESEDQQVLDDAYKDKVIKYGDYVLIQSRSGATWQVQFVCPGRVGPVKTGDHLSVMEVSEVEKCDSKGKPSWGLSSSNLFSTSICLQSMGKGAHRTPLMFTIHAQKFYGTEATRKLSLFPSPNSRENARQRGLPAPLSVLVYNIWMLPSQVTSWAQFARGTSLHKLHRARLIPDALQRAIEDVSDPLVKDLDIAVLTEAYCPVATTTLVAGLKRTFGLYFETTILGSGAAKLARGRSIANGGVVVLSRFPIVRTEARIFQDANREDRMYNKGVYYVCLRRAGTNVHIFSTNLQQGSGPACVKTRQYQALVIREFIQDMNIPPSEIVLVAGTLNFCKFRQPKQYMRMMDILGAKDAYPSPDAHFEADTLSDSGSSIVYPNFQDPGRPISNSRKSVRSFEHSDIQVVATDDTENLLTFNPAKNTLATLVSTKKQSQVADYCLISRYNLLPKRMATYVLHEVVGDEALLWRGSTHRDLSKNFPILTHFEFS